MSRSAPVRRLAVHYRTGIGLLLCLLAFTAWVERCFVPGWLARHYADPFPLLGDRTRGRALGVLFDLLPVRVPRTGRVVAFLGDSSVGGAHPPKAFLPWKLREALAVQTGGPVEVVDGTIIGLYAQDALVLAAKMLAVEPDLVVYAVSPRVVPAAPPTPWATTVADVALDPDVVGHLGLGPVLDLIGASALGRSLVYSWWAPARLRTVLARALVLCAEGRVPAVGAVLARLVPAPTPPPPASEGRGGYLWPRDRYRVDFPTRSRRAFETLLDVCARERRCLLYHVPVNPAAVGGFEPGLDDEFTAWVTRETARRGVPFVDHRPFGRPEHFKTNVAGRPDAIHPLEAGHAAFAPVLAATVAAHLGASRR